MNDDETVLTSDTVRDSERVRELGVKEEERVGMF